MRQNVYRFHLRTPVRAQGLKRQSGAVLVVSLIMLLVLTLVGVSAMQSTSMEERMASNMRSGDVAFQAAEAALRDGEEWIMNIDMHNPPAQCTSAPCDLWQLEAFGEYPENNNLGWWNINAREYDKGAAGAVDFANSAQDPRFITEYLRYDPGLTVVDADERAQQIGPHMMRVTSLGVGPDANVVRALETTVRVIK